MIKYVQSTQNYKTWTMTIYHNVQCIFTVLAEFSDCLIIVRLSICPSESKLFTFSSSSLEPQGQFNQTWHKNFLVEGNSFFFSNQWQCPFPRGDINEIAWIHWWPLKILLQHYLAILKKKTLAQLNHSWVKGIQGCLDEGVTLFQGEIRMK